MFRVSAEIEPFSSAPCTPSPCGSNALCKEQNGVGSCTCLPDYIGNPYEGCRPECVMNSDCMATRACIRSRCQDPCPGSCATNAECQVVNHLPSCTCFPGYTGQPYQFCQPMTVGPSEQPFPFLILPMIVFLETSTTNLPFVVIEDRGDPCSPSPCGPNSRCQVVNDQAVCSCLPEYTGSPPGCRPECVVSSECSSNLACINQKCRNPCPGPCGIAAECNVIHHSPICACRAKYTGDPFTRCFPMPGESAPCNLHLPRGISIFTHFARGYNFF